MLLLKKANLLFVTHGSEKRYCTRPTKDFTGIKSMYRKHYYYMVHYWWTYQSFSDQGESHC